MSGRAWLIESIASRSRNGSGELVQVNVAELGDGHAFKLSRESSNRNIFPHNFKPVPLKFACIQGHAACAA
jgi:hypothetical protein